MTTFSGKRTRQKHSLNSIYKYVLWTQPSTDRGATEWLQYSLLECVILVSGSHTTRQISCKTLTSVIVCLKTLGSVLGSGGHSITQNPRTELKKKTRYSTRAGKHYEGFFFFLIAMDRLVNKWSIALKWVDCSVALVMERSLLLFRSSSFRSRVWSIL